MRRLDQLLANLGYCSRRGARDFLKQHEVVLTGDTTRLSDSAIKVDPERLLINGEPLDHPDGLLLLVNKPTGLVCSHDEREGPNVYSLLPERWRGRNPQITSIGRLDKDTSGLILLTDLTPLVHRLTSPKHHVPKRYLATLNGAVPESLIPLFAAGTLLLEGERAPCAPAHLEILGERRAALTLTEGRYHQVRRMFAAHGLTVLTLHRERFGSLTLSGVPEGQFKELPLSFFD
ncbi:MAG TPA: pseudouridine synthase [Opitutaceae bacterium]|nr:pseudouridine synthase [Opitutaceae bacterium]